jgi:hypothetical protein
MVSLGRELLTTLTRDLANFRSNRWTDPFESVHSTLPKRGLRDSNSSKPLPTEMLLDT